MTPEEINPESKGAPIPTEPVAPPEPIPEPPKLPLGKRVREPVEEEFNSSDDAIRTWYRENTVGTRNRELAGAVVAMILFGLIPLSCTGLFWAVCGRGFH